MPFLRVIQNQIPAVPSNYSDQELAKHVRHYFPNLTGPLNALLERFEARTGMSVISGPSGDTGKMACAHCGSLLQVEEA